MKSTTVTININKLVYLDAEPHIISGVVTRIWTLSVKRSQLRSDKVTRIWISHVKGLEK